MTEKQTKIFLWMCIFFAAATSVVLVSVVVREKKIQNERSIIAKKEMNEKERLDNMRKAANANRPSEEEFNKELQQLEAVRKGENVKKISEEEKKSQLSALNQLRNK